MATMPYKNILCAITIISKEIWLVERALYISGDTPEQITVLLSCEHPLSGSGEYTHTDITENAIRQHRASESAPLLQQLGIPPQNLLIDFGSPLHCLQKHTRRLQPDLVLMSQQPHHGYADTRFGAMLAETILVKTMLFETSARALATLDTDLLICQPPDPHHK
jgi:nucleotide-binding universal stress UspA family protein